MCALSCVGTFLSIFLRQTSPFEDGIMAARQLTAGGEVAEGDLPPARGSGDGRLLPGRDSAFRSHVGVYHLLDQLPEVDCRMPAEFRMGLGRVADQDHDIGGPEERSSWTT